MKDVQTYYAYKNETKIEKACDQLESTNVEPNLESLWHDVNEEPQDGSHILMQYNYEGDKELKSFHIKYDEYMNWQKLVKIYGISQWAYINDMLPKGGEQ